jgi:hypothetical protein
MGDFMVRLTSRKFLVVAAAFVLVVLYPEHEKVFMALAGIYVGGEGSRDVVQSYVDGKTTQNAKKLSAELMAGGIQPPANFDSANPATLPPAPTNPQGFVTGQ